MADTEREQLTFEKHFQRNDPFCSLLTRDEHVAKFSFSERSTYIEIVESPAENQRNWDNR